MPVSKGTYANNETKIYYFLTKSGLNTAAACGILANLYAEGGFNPRNLQNTYESSLGYTDNSYTSAVDSGKYKKFSTDSAGYGLAQWTYSTRKTALLRYAKHSGTSIGDIDTQLNFLLQELKSDYSTLWAKLIKVSNTAAGAETAGIEFCKDFERPAGGSTTAAKRGVSARDEYWEFYSTPANLKDSQPVEDIGSKIVTIAKNQVGKSYESNKNGPTTFDSPGLVYYCYNQAGYKLNDMTASGYYESYRNSPQTKVISSNNVSPGDLLFYKERTTIEYMAIADGNGGRIYARPGVDKITYDTTLGSPDHIFRILSDSQTTTSSSSGGGTSSIGGDSIGPLVLSATDSHAEIISQNLSRVSAEGYDYGYLIDLTHGGEFKFYIPEFSEQAGARWSPVDIRGRSVTVQSYDSTSSRVITVSLDLYAGAGLYNRSSSDVVSDLHKDANFVKSLEYPDYTSAITEPPPTVQLILGASIDITGVVSGVSVEHLKPLDQYNRSMYIKLSFTVTQTAKNPPDYRDIRGGQYTLTDTMNVGSFDTTDSSRGTNSLSSGGNKSSVLENLSTSESYVRD